MIRHFIKHSKQFLVTLRFSILSLFITLLLLTILSMIFINTIRFTRELGYISKKYMSYIAEDALHHLNAGVSPAGVAAQFSGNLIKTGTINATPAALVPYTQLMLETFPIIKRIFWLTPTKQYIASYRALDGTIGSDIYGFNTPKDMHWVIIRNRNNQIIRKALIANRDISLYKTDWYQRAERTQSFFWANYHQFYTIPKIWGVTAIQPIWHNHQFQGLYGLNLSLNYLSRYLVREHGAHGYVFIVTHHEDLVAYPLIPPFINYATPTNQLLNVHQVKMPIIDAALDRYKKTGKNQINITYCGIPYIISYQVVPAFAQYGWLIGVVVPRSYFTKSLVEADIMILGVSALVLIVGIIIMSGLVTYIVKPIKKLVNETDKIKKFELDSPMHVRTRIKEVVLLRDAIKSMKNGLKQFQKYVPRSLVRKLIHTGNDLKIGGERKKLAVLFSDIENSTSIASMIDANEFTMQLCDYFELMTNIINEEKGTIDKFIGDAIMAFWGAPLTTSHPATHAARAALKCQAALSIQNANWKKQGQSEFKTRIGIHLGEAIVGNVGSSERINYTAIGDTINIASFLQTVNKTYHTQIIASEAVYSVIHKKFNFRKLGEITVKGHDAPMTIYELLSEK